jgi:hypothetical protein
MYSTPVLVPDVEYSVLYCQSPKSVKNNSLNIGRIKHLMLVLSPKLENRRTQICALYYRCQSLLQSQTLNGTNLKFIVMVHGHVLVLHHEDRVADHPYFFQSPSHMPPILIDYQPSRFMASQSALYVIKSTYKSLIGK